MMPDRMETIKGLELVRDICQAKAFISVGEGRTAWNGYAGIQDNAIILLQGREPVEPLAIRKDIVDEIYDWIAECPACGMTWAMWHPEKMHYCPQCGKAVKWADEG